MTYADRDRLIESLGFADYQAYLASDLWRGIKARVYRWRGSGCQLCDRPATEVHHGRYQIRDLNGQRIVSLHPLCRECHREVEFYPEGDKRPLIAAAKEFDRRRRVVKAEKKKNRDFRKIRRKKREAARRASQ